MEIDLFMGENHVLFLEIFFQTRIHVRGLWLTCNLLPKQTQFVTGFKLLETKIGQAVKGELIHPCVAAHAPLPSGQF